MQLKLRDNELNFVMLTLFVYVSTPFVEAYNLYNSLLNGDFPSDADSIGIPIFGIFIICILLAPFILTFIIWALWKSPTTISLFGFNRKRPMWSFIWSLIFVFPFFIFLFSAIGLLSQFCFVESMHAFLIAFLLLFYRAIVVFRKRT
jgi:hypothetical protein